MAAVPFKRVADAFDMAARARVICEPQSSFTDLSYLVNSFLETDTASSGQEINSKQYITEEEEEDDECAWENSLDLLRTYLEQNSKDKVISNIQAHVQSASCRIHIDASSPDFKRQLMTTLRETGFDAGLCKTKWSKTVNSPPGNYDYIDVNVSGTRYIVEVSIGAEFQVARSTHTYQSLLKILPQIFVGKTETLKQIIRLMCRGIRKCMRKYEMHVPPWRRYAYMQAKWFTSNYKRTINHISAKKTQESDDKSTKKRAVGFVTVPAAAGSTHSYSCREDCVTKLVGSRVGNLAMAMNGNGLLL